MSAKEKSDSRSEQYAKLREDRESRQSVSSQSEDSDAKKKRRNACSKDKRKKSKHRSSSSSSSSSSVSSREGKQNDRDKQNDKWDKRYENGVRPYRMNIRDSRGHYKGRSGYMDNRKRNFGYRPYKHSGFYDRNRIQNQSHYNRYNSERRGHRFSNHNNRRPPYDRSRSRSTQDHDRSSKERERFQRAFAGKQFEGKTYEAF